MIRGFVMVKDDIAYCSQRAATERARADSVSSKAVAAAQGNWTVGNETLADRYKLRPPPGAEN